MAVGGNAVAQTYPTRPVRLVVGFSPGGIADVIARLIAQSLSERLRQTFVVENVSGAAGTLAMEAVARAPADGYTILLISAVDAITTTLYQKQRFNLLTDITPIAGIYRDGPGVMLLHPSTPAASVPEFIAYAKANSGKLNMGSAGVGTTQHLYGELFKMLTGIELIHVPYRGAPQAVTDLISGRLHVIFDTLGNATSHIKSGQVRALAVTTASRVAMMPDVPTIAESVPGYEGSGWQGIGAPKSTPIHIVDLLNKATNESLRTPQMKRRFAELGYQPFETDPAALGEFVTRNIEKWAKVIRFASVRPE